MIKFFRNIRRRLLRENRFTRYLIYAIGEIILVVIGILIALQLNNLNERKKDREYSSVMLKEIYGDLVSDYNILYEGIEPRLERKLNSLDTIKNYMATGIMPSDSTFMLNYYRINLGFFLSQSMGGYEALKQGGINKVTNDNLRNLLFRFYETIIVRLTMFISGHDPQLEDEVQRLEEDLFNYRFKAINDSTFVHMQLPKGNIINHQSLHRIYEKLFRDALNKRNRLESLKKEYLNLISVLESELEEREMEFKKMDTLSWVRDFKLK